MPSVRLSVHATGPVLPAVSPTVGPVDVYRPQFRCLLRLPNTLLPRDSVIDTGAPLICFPEDLWRPFRVGIDFEWLPFAPGPAPPVGRLVGWHFTFRMTRFLTPVTLLDYSTEIDRPGVVARSPPATRPRRRAANRSRRSSSACGAGCSKGAPSPSAATRPAVTSPGRWRSRS